MGGNGMSDSIFDEDETLTVSTGLNRLKKSDIDIIKEAFKHQGYGTIRGGGCAVEATAEDGSYVCGVYWEKNGRGWRFDSPRPLLRTHKDLDIALDELRRDRQANEATEVAWERYKKSKSKKNWKLYMGTLAAFYLRLSE